jgi:hypothetical protein
MLGYFSMILFNITTLTAIAFAAAAVCVSNIFVYLQIIKLCLQCFLHLFKIHKTHADICRPCFHAFHTLAIINFATSLFYTFLHILQPVVGIPCSLPV